MGKIIRQSIVMLALLTVVTGVVYPLLATGLAQVLFPRAANGSLIERDGKVAGSELIGQSFSDPKYFWSRPSATAPFADNSAASTGSNLGPTNPALTDAVAQRIHALRAAEVYQELLDKVLAAKPDSENDLRRATKLSQRSPWRARRASVRPRPPNGARRRSFVWTNPHSGRSPRRIPGGFSRATARSCSTNGSESQRSGTRSGAPSTTAFRGVRSC